MDFHLNAQVRNADGDILGALQRVVYIPDSREVDCLIVLRSGLMGEEVILPIDTIADNNEHDLEINLPASRFDELMFYNETRNIAPPPDAAEVDSDLVHDPVDVPDILPIGAATGVESIAFTPIVEELSYLPPGEQVIDHATVVWATDGELGKVAAVRTEGRTSRVTAIQMRHGGVFTHAVEIPVDWVENVLPETIVLTVDRATVEATQDA